MLIDRRTAILGAAATFAAVRTAEGARPDTVEAPPNGQPRNNHLIVIQLPRVNIAGVGHCRGGPVEVAAKA